MSDRYTLNKNLAQMLKGGVIMDVTNVEQAKIAEDAGAVAVMALERVPADIRKEGGVARMSDPKMIREIKEAVSIPVMAKARIGHFVEAQILQARADFANAKVYYERVKKVGPKAMSKTEFDNAKAKYLSAQAAVAQARANYNLAKVNFDYTEINAPIAGIVGEMSLTPGDYVSPGGQPLFTIIQYDPIRVVFSITDKDYLEELKSGPLFAEDKIKLRLADGKIYNALGDYQYADNKVDRSTNSIAVYADFPNASKALVANAYVDVLVEKNYRNVVLVSKKIVTLDADGDYVYLVNGNKLQKSKVVILGEKGGDYVLQNNFKAGDYLVLDKVSPQIASTKIKINVVGKTSAGEKA